MPKMNEFSSTSYSSLTEEVLQNMVEVGIPLNEGRIYLALLLEPDIPASRLCEITGIPDSKVYSMLESATKLNMVEVQYGVPKTYRATPPSPMIAEIESSLKSRYEKGIQKSELIEAQLLRVWNRIGKNVSDESGMEIAYVVKGTKNIISKIKEMIMYANHDIMVILPELSLFSSMREQLLEAKLRGVSIRIALPQIMLNKMPVVANSFNLFVLSQQCSNTWLIVADGRLLTVSRGGSENDVSAILTRDKVLVQMSEAYFENPSCCFRP